MRRIVSWVQYLGSLTIGPQSAKSRAPHGLVWPPEKCMANRAIWSMRLRHEWLKTPLKKARFKKSQRIRLGYEDALLRKGIVTSEQQKAK